MIQLENLKMVNESWLRPSTLSQEEAARRLEISEKYLRDLDEFGPPRLLRGRGRKSQYRWPALLFWCFDLQIAREYQHDDQWAYFQWAERMEYRQDLEELKHEIEEIIKLTEKSRTPAPIVRRMRALLSAPDRNLTSESPATVPSLRENRKT